MSMKRQEGYKKTDVGVIPVDWNIKKLEEISKLSSGTTPSRKLENRYYSNGTINWVKTTDLNNGYIIYTEEKITNLALDETCLREYNIGTVLVAMYGGFNQIGRTGLLKIPATVNQALIAIQSQPQTLNPIFLINYLNFRVGYWKNVAISSRKDPNITSKDVKNFIIPLPPLLEQKAIAQSLSDVDTLITALDQVITKKRNIKQSTMQQLLTGKKRLPGFIGEWKVKKLEDISTEIGDGIHATPEYVESSEFYFINGNNLVHNSIEINERTKCVAQEEYRKYKKNLNDTTILMSINGTIGNIAFYQNENVILGKSAAYINIKNFISKTYIFYVLQTQAVNCYFEDELTGSTIRNLSLKSIRNAPISVPPKIEEQQAIAQVLSDMDAEIEALEKKRDKYKAIKQGMMQELLTGKTRLINS